MQDIHILGIVGAGAMGRGIAQIAAQAGVRVKLHDASGEAVAAALDMLRQTWDKLVQKGKLTAADAQAALARIEPAATLQDLAGCQAVVEAVVERLDVKREVFAKLESIVADDCILASNTSSLSITAIATACKLPSRVVGYHFFNPVPLMKVVEVIDGLCSDPAAGDALMALARRMGHTPVRAKDMPGFIVNHAGRGMLIEGLRAAQEAVAGFDQIDAVMREQAGFRMGPFELLDLTGLDVSHPVMESIYQQFYDEPRYRPSPITAVRHVGGMLGRKTGAGFYDYIDGQKQVAAEPAAPALPAGLKVWVSRHSSQGYARAMALISTLGVTVCEKPEADALFIVTPYGQDISTSVTQQGLDAARTVGLDTLHEPAPGRRRTLMLSPATQPAWRDAAHALLASDGAPVSVIADSAGFIAQRIIAHVVNIACDIAQQRIATPEDIDRAVTLGLGYPMGPLALGDALGAHRIHEILVNMQRVTGDMRYRPSLWLQRRVQLDMSLLAPAAA